MPRLLTVGIAETKNEEFKVVNLEIPSDGKVKKSEWNKFISLQINREDFFDGDECLWDNLALTEVDEVVNKYGEIYSAKGNITLINRINKEKLKKIFEILKCSWTDFENDKSKKYAIVKVDAISGLFYTTNNGVKHRMEIICNGKVLKILNKDFRWVQYWNRCIENETYKEKVDYYKDYLNKKNIYILVYEHIYPNNTQRWIAGMHCL